LSNVIQLSWDEASGEEQQLWLDEAQNRMPQVHANRKCEWALARICLARAFEEHSIKLIPKNCIFKNHHELTHLPAWRFSLSHTKDLACAWLEPSHLFRGLGVDIEFNNRTVPAQVKSRLAHQEDIKIPSLELWSLKEAAYKALPTLAQSDIWLNRIIIQDHHFELESSPFHGLWSLQKDERCIIARAWIEA
jgi:4'-phosphopantetheinyl transferase EntD